MMPGSCSQAPGAMSPSSGSNKAPPMTSTMPTLLSFRPVTFGSAGVPGLLYFDCQVSRRGNLVLQQGCAGRGAVDQDIGARDLNSPSVIEVLPKREQSDSDSKTVRQAIPTVLYASRM